MNIVVVVLVVVVVLLIAAALSIRVVLQYQKGVVFRLGRVVGVREPGLNFIIPIIDQLRKVSVRIVTMPIQSQGIITRDNVSVDISAVAYFRVIDAEKSVVAIENVYSAIDQIAQTTLRKVVGQHTLDQALAETGVINADIRKSLDITTLEWGVEVTLVELKDIQLPESMKRAMARQAEAEREKRAKIIAAEGRIPGRRSARRRLGHHDGSPAGPATTQPADPDRTRRRQEHHGRVPGAADERDRRDRYLLRPRNRRGRSIIARTAGTVDAPARNDPRQRRRTHHLPDLTCVSCSTE